MKAKVIINSKIFNAREKSDEIKRYLDDLDVDFECTLTERKHHAEEIARNSDGYELIVACGGDGTVNEVVNGIMGLDKILSVIPLGGGNDFAKSLRISKNLEKACKQLCNGRIKLIDVGILNSRYFVSSGGAGLDGEVIKNLDKVPRYVPRPLRYFYSAISLDKKPKEMAIEIDGRGTSEGRRLVAMVLNTPYAGNGMKVAPYAKLDDGILDLLVVGDMPLVEFGMNLPKVYLGKHITHPKIQYEQVKEVCIHAKSPVYAQVDGELFEDTLQEIYIGICPKALKVKC